ncbi:MAG: CHAT domain-containing protein [Roseiflexus sp.]|uniref:CHAT domain-containing protein n=1 Tax=Roseiflexus sp. TaxID=2562120 RepID=UPI0025F0D98C|nr:CHAT domain-containing protein [Roseiflexus sp.]MCL6541103.1 CHAT domain-containing protein [Roseiflexus sp.]
MPVDFNKLTLAPINACVIAEETASLWQIYAMLPPKRDDRLYRFVVTPLADGTFIVARWIEVEEIVHRLLRYDDVRNWTLVDLANYVPPPDYVEPDDHIAAKLATIPLANLIQRLKPASALDRQAHTTHQARTARDDHPGRRIVVLDNSVIYGVVFEEPLMSGDVAADPFAQPTLRMAAPSDEPTYLPETADIIYADVAPSESPVDGGRGEMADVSEPERPASTLLNTISHSGSQDDRVFNLWIEQRLVQEAEIVGGGRTLTRVVPPNEALSVGGMYTVNVNVAAPLASARVRSGGVEQAEEMTTATQIEVDVRLVADGGFFKVYGIPQQKIIFPRGGVSKNLASFTIEPLKQGVGEITAILSLNQKPFQKIVAQVAIGDTALAALPAEPVRASGLTLAAAATTMSNPRAYPPETDASLVIIRETTGYTFLLSLGSGYTVARLNLAEKEIVDAIRRARASFLDKIVKKLDPSRNVYAYQLKDTTIPEAIHQEVLRDLRQIGDLLFRALFFAPGSGDQGREMGHLLRATTAERELRINVIAERFAFPWSLIYALPFKPTDPVDPNGFWGYRHIIEYTPQFSARQPTAFAPEIRAGDRLHFGFVFDQTIDAQFNAPIIGEQRQILPGISGVNVTEYDTRDKFLDLLSRSQNVPHIIYFYGHAVSRSPGEKDAATGIEYGLGDSYLSINGEAVTLDEMNLYAGLDLDRFDSAPLVILNACESAELSPELYNGLVPYLIGRGARGVIGTEVLMPAYFAAEFAPALLRRFAAGNTRLGDLLRDLRREYLREKRNVLPLIYALYSNAELIVTRNG